MKIRYKAADKEGKISHGLIDGRSIEEAVEYLRRKDLTPITLDRIDNKIWNNIPFISQKVKTQELVLFTRQLSSMISSGLTLTKALEILKMEIKNETFVEIVTTIINDIQEGKTFSQAIEKHPQVFSPIYISIVKAGEQAGLLDKVLIRLTENLEKQSKLKATIKSALMYPFIVIIMMFGVALIMAFFVIPQLTGLYTSLNVEIPLPTKIVIGLAKLITSYWFLTILVVGIFVYGYRKWVATPSGKLIIDTLVLKLPVFGKLIKQTMLTEFSRTFGLLVGSGTLVVQSLIQTADVTGNVLYKTAILDVSKMVEKGESIGEAMSSYELLFPPMLIQLVKIGEQTGKIDESLLKASEYMEREVDQTVKTLTTAMEPFIMVILGVGVAFLVFSVITPIYSLINSVQ